MAFLWCIYIFVCVPSCLSVAEFQVSAYVGQDVVLSCGVSEEPSVNCFYFFRIRWYLEDTNGDSFPLVIHGSINEVHANPSLVLEGRVEAACQYLIIRDIRVSDAGKYSCECHTCQSTTHLVVHYSTPWIPKLVTLGVFMLIVAVMAAVTYVIIRRTRREAIVKYDVRTAED
ncbi:immunoglobulin superfamily member [Entelurus aequoreus]|uniref:immunoglobulin superfamily member n=1 Tax=Entelurus aequoreus TaxID=161455 RepID=UPI002B1DE2FB|nr:immunoglobulin superfamily member [Entelurus aequoreus]